MLRKYSSIREKLRLRRKDKEKQKESLSQALETAHPSSEHLDKFFSKVERCLDVGINLDEWEEEKKVSKEPRLNFTCCWYGITYVSADSVEGESDCHNRQAKCVDWGIGTPPGGGFGIGSAQFPNVCFRESQSCLRVLRDGQRLGLSCASQMGLTK